MKFWLLSVVTKFLYFLYIILFLFIFLKKRHHLMPTFDIKIHLLGWGAQGKSHPRFSASH